MATINGKPSLFITPQPPTATCPVYSDRVADFTNIAEGMATEAELTAHAEAEARKHTLCPTCQAKMVNWRLANPTATKVDAESAHADIWLQCPPCSADFAQWCEKLDAEWQNDPEAQRKFGEWCDAEERKARQAELETAEHEAYEAHLEAQAEAHDLARLGESGMHAIAGHDLIWQAGGSL